MERKKIGLALSGGGARGYSHLGVLRVLERAGIQIDMAAGCSAGSIVGAAIAAGLKADDIIKFSRKLGWFDVSAFSYSPKGLLTNEPLGRFIENNFPLTRFEELEIPLAIVACDLATGKEVVFRDEGNVAEAVRASCAIPGVFVPVIGTDGKVLIDGGIASPMPTRAVRKLGADKVIAVDLLTCGSVDAGTPNTLVGTFIQAAMMMIRNSSKSHHYRADIIIEPAIAHIRPDEIKRADELIELGEAAAEEKLEEILAMAGS
ncbi:MAG: patatin-like phospholipase family protein [Acidobacteria bacterium]|nr:patatin-like phospholipase family protein [Acidobacteriota bacterium]